jgi:fatty acid desaturase
MDERPPQSRASPGPPRWWTPPLDRQQLAALMRRSDLPGLASLALWLALLAACGWLAARLYPSAWSIPLFLLYGTIYTTSNSRWHESLHGTPFRTPWLNRAVYFATAAMDFRDMVFARRSHLNHHGYTLMTARDLEMLPRPMRLWKVWIEFFALYSGPVFLGAMVLHALGRPTRMARRVVAEAEWPALFWAARAALLLWLAPIAVSVALRSCLPVLLFGLPRFYGGALVWLFVVSQHAGLATDVTDHRLNCRSLRLNPVLSFLFMNMESHTEHHVYPNVPFHALPRLRRLMAPHMPPPYRGLWAAWKEILPALRAQRRDPRYFVRRELPG